MLYLWIALGVLLFLTLATLAITYICFRISFYVPRNRTVSIEEFPLPIGEIYEPYHDTMTQWIQEARAMPSQTFTTTSFDGLRLQATYYEYAPGAPIELMFHGYRGSAERDLCGGIQRCFALGRSALVVDQRTTGGSEGSVITFGIHERRDCHSWVDFMIRHFGKDVKIILTGLSMGASTVMMAAGEPLPDNVVGVLADCGFTSSRAIMLPVIAKMGLPAKLAYPFVRLGARLFGHFDLEETSPVEAMARCRLPVIFFHGQQDNYVPCAMSQENYDACAGEKKLVIIPGADHGLSYLVQPEVYLQELDAFFRPYLTDSKH